LTFYSKPKLASDDVHIILAITESCRFAQAIKHYNLYSTKYCKNS